MFFILRTQPEDDEQDRFIDLQGESSETRALKMVDEREACDDTAFYDLKSTETTNGNVHRVEPKTEERSKEPPHQTLYDRLSNPNHEKEGSSNRIVRNRDHSYLDKLPGSYITSQEGTNFARLLRAIFDLCTDVYRNILHMICQPVDLKTKMQRCSTQAHRIHAQDINDAVQMGSYSKLDLSMLYNVIRTLSTENIADALMATVKPKDICDAVVRRPDLKLNAKEIRNINLAKSKGSYAEFDYDLLVKLYRNLCTTRELKILIIKNSAWGTEPCSKSIDLGDDIERIRILRNRIVHSSESEISDRDFAIHRDELKCIMTRMDERFNSNYKANLDMILTCPMDIGLMNENMILKQYTAEVRQSVLDVNSELCHVKDKMNLLTYENKEMNSELCQVKEEIRFLKYENKERNQTNRLNNGGECEALGSNVNATMQNDEHCHLRHRTLDSLEVHTISEIIPDMAHDIKLIKERQSDFQRLLESYVLVPVSLVVWVLKSLFVTIMVIMVIVIMFVLFHLYRS